MSETAVQRRTAQETLAPYTGVMPQVGPEHPDAGSSVCRDAEEQEGYEQATFGDYDEQLERYDSELWNLVQTVGNLEDDFEHRFEDAEEHKRYRWEQDGGWSKDKEHEQVEVDGETVSVKHQGQTQFRRYNPLVEPVLEYVAERYEADNEPVTIRIADLGSSDGRAIARVRTMVNDYIAGLNHGGAVEGQPYDERRKSIVEDVHPDDVTIETYELDISQELLSRGKEDDIAKHPVQSAVQYLPFEPDTFDIIISNQMLTHFPADEIDTIMSEEINRVEHDESIEFLSTGDGHRDREYNEAYADGNERLQQFSL